MSYTGYLSLVLIAVIILTVVIYLRVQVKLNKTQQVKRARQQQLAVQLNPLYHQHIAAERAYTVQQVEQEPRFQLERQKLELERRKQNADIYLSQQQADRAHAIELRRLELEEKERTTKVQLMIAEFEHRRQLELTRVTPETYLLDYQPTNITPLASLRALAKDKEQPPDYLLETRCF